MVKELDTPSCAECLLIGLPMPDMLLNMEIALGADEVRRFVAVAGGTHYSIPQKPSKKMPQFNDVNAWLRENIGWGTITIPKGPLNRTSRLRWSIYLRLRKGQSLRSIAVELDCHMRTVTTVKKIMQQSNQLDRFASAQKDTLK